MDLIIDFIPVPYISTIYSLCKTIYENVNGFLENKKIIKDLMIRIIYLLKTINDNTNKNFESNIKKYINLLDIELNDINNYINKLNKRNTIVNFILNQNITENLEDYEKKINTIITDLQLALALNTNYKITNDKKEIIPDTNNSDDRVDLQLLQCMKTSDANYICEEIVKEIKEEKCKNTKTLKNIIDNLEINKDPKILEIIKPILLELKHNKKYNRDYINYRYNKFIEDTELTKLNINNINIIKRNNKNDKKFDFDYKKFLQDSDD